MNEELRKNELFQTAHIMILVCYTLVSIILIGEAILLGWESWALILILVSIIVAWRIHFKEVFSEYTRLWIYSMLMMATYFFYGIHRTSTYDLCAVMTAVIMLYTMTGVVPLITLCQGTFFLTFAFDIMGMIHDGEVFSFLVVTRSLLHLAVVIMAGWIARVIIERWSRALGKVTREIAVLKDETGRLNDFLANVSHEIRTPANAVIGFTGICLEEEEKESIIKNMTQVMKAGQKISDQISDILDYSEIDRRILANNKEEYMLASIVNDVREVVAPAVPEGLELIINVDPSIPCVMKADQGKLKKILRHLIENALKYTKKGGVYVNIYPLWESYGLNLCIEVEDTGIGMDKAEAEKALSGRYQGDSSRTRQGGGLGLGLSVVSGFVASMGGFMSLKSSVGEGTRVRISIPNEIIDKKSCMSLASKESLHLGAYVRFDKFESPDVRVFYGRLMRTIVEGLDITIHRVDSLNDLKRLAATVPLTHLLTGKEEYARDASFMRTLAKNTMLVVAGDRDDDPASFPGAVLMKKPVTGLLVAEFLNMEPGKSKEKNLRMMCPSVRALVVDDEPMNLSVAKGILGRYGMEIETVISGYEAVDACAAKDYDIVFMDHMMPGMDGVETARRIRHLSRNAESGCMIVALTANAVSTAKEMFLKEGFDGFLSKPIEIGELERIIKKVLPKSKIEYEEVRQNDPHSGAVREEKDTKENSSPYARLAQTGIDTEQGIFFCQGDAEFYDSLLLQFSQEATAKSKRIIEALEKNDRKNYEVFVHAVKSTAKMIGAMELSEEALALETMASEGKEIETALHAKMIRDFTDVAAAIEEAFGCEQAKPGEAIAEAEAEPLVTVMEFEPEPEES